MSSKTSPLIVGYLRNYSYPDILRQSKDGKGMWNELKFVDLDKQPLSKVDVLLVLNHPTDDINMKVRKGGKIIIMQEPPYEKNNYLKTLTQYFDLTISGFDKTPCPINLSIPAGLPWHINKTYQELSSDLPNNTSKMDRVSWITSSANSYDGHKIRMDFIDFLKSNTYDFDLFGRGFNPIDSKFDGINPYKYSIAAENYIAPNYFTEKILDVYLSDAIPMYYGCENISDFFPKNSYIELDLKRQQWSLDKIKEAVAGNYYDAHKHEIKEAKNRILNEFQLFPLIEKMLDNNLNISEKHENVKINKDGLTRLQAFKKKIKKRF